MNWDDLKIFLAAARDGTFQSAGARMGLDATTVGRRMARLESGLKSTLFVRSPAGLTLTAEGARLFEAAMGVEQAVDGVSSAHGAVSGVVRISASEGFGTAVLAPELPALMNARPNLRIELAANPGFLSPATREVDLAVTLGAPRDARLSVEKLTDYHLALYASPAYLKAHGSPKTRADLLSHKLVGYIDDMIYADALKYLDEIHPGLKTAISSSSIRAQQELIVAGAGIGVLPCFLARTAGSELKRVLEDVVIVRAFWLAAHRDVLETARMREVRDWIRALVKRKRKDLLA